MKPQKLVSVAAAGLLAAAAVSACSSSSKTASSSATSAGSSATTGGTSSSGSSNTTVVIGYENNGAVDPTQATQSLGYWQKYIKAKIKTVYFSSGPAALTALGSGSVDIMTGIGNPPVASALATHVPLAVVWDEEDSLTDQALVVRGSSHISSVAQLKGQTVATVVGSTSSYALTGVLQQAGLSSTAVKVLNLTPQAIETAWKTGQINAAYIWYPVLGALLSSGGVEIANDKSVLSSYPINNLSVVNKSWAAQHTQLVDEFIQAQNAGVLAFRNDLSSTLAAELADTGETLTEAKLEAKTTENFDVSQQLGPDALGTSDSNSLVAKSLLIASQYLHSLDASAPVLTSVSGMIDRSYVQAVMNSGS